MTFTETLRTVLWRHSGDFHSAPFKHLSSILIVEGVDFSLISLYTSVTALMIPRLAISLGALTDVVQSVTGIGQFRIGVATPFLSIRYRGICLSSGAFEVNSRGN